MATNKSIQDIIFKSRLTIKYRTEISGTPVEAKLPFRVLVLGDFSGKSAHEGGFHGDLGKRSVRSITKGMKPDQLLQMEGYSLKVSDPRLTSSFPGTLQAISRFTMDDLKVPPGGDGELSRPIQIDSESHTVTFSSPKAQNGVTDIKKCNGFLKATLRFSTTAGDVGNFLGVKLTLRGRVFDQQLDDATNKIVGDVSGRISRSSSDEIPLTPLKGSDLTWTGAIPEGGTIMVKQNDGVPVTFTLSVTDVPLKADRTIPILRMQGFNPDDVAQSLPELHRLFLIKQLLQELKTEIQSRPDLRKALSDLLKKRPEEVKALNTRLQAELPKLSV